MTDRDRLIFVLGLMGAAGAGHSGRKLMDHLLGTYDLLSEAGCAPEVCLAGGLHSIYGTNVFRTVSTVERGPVRETFGERAERLAWLFCNVNRPRGLDDGRLVDWQTKDSVTVDDATLHDLRMIEAANLLEQGESLARFPRVEKAWRGQCH